MPPLVMFAWTWKFFHQTVDKSAVAPAFVEKPVPARLFEVDADWPVKSEGCSFATHFLLDCTADLILHDNDPF